MSYDHWKTSPPDELCAHCGAPFTARNCVLCAEDDAGRICDDCAGAMLGRHGYVPTLPARDTELAIREVRECLERQLPQGIDNAARHIVACIDEFGRTNL